jgi:hypothetical protein
VEMDTCGTGYYPYKVESKWLPEDCCPWSEDLHILTDFPTGVMVGKGFVDGSRILLDKTIAYVGRYFAARASANVIEDWGAWDANAPDNDFVTDYISKANHTLVIPLATRLFGADCSVDTTIRVEAVTVKKRDREFNGKPLRRIKGTASVEHKGNKGKAQPPRLTMAGLPLHALTVREMMLQQDVDEYNIQKAYVDTLNPKSLSVPDYQSLCTTHNVRYKKADARAVMLVSLQKYFSIPAQIWVEQTQDSDDDDEYKDVRMEGY